MSEVCPPRGAFFLAGATGSGKSAVALCLAESVPADIICGDAYQIYRGMPILTAQPSAEDLARAPHRLYGCVDPGEESDAARFNRMARAEIEASVAAGRTALVTGGSGLYLKALTHGLAPVPPGDAALRTELEQLSAEELAARLTEADPVSAARLNLRNPRHVLRALEITLLTGRPASELKTTWNADPPLCGVFLHRPRTELRARIRRRCEAMFHSGLADEVKSLLTGPLSSTAGKAIGLAETRAVLEGRMTQADAVEAISIATGQYAKRQDNWFRRETCLLPLEVGDDEPPPITAGRILQAFPTLAEHVSASLPGAPAAE